MKKTGTLAVAYSQHIPPGIFIMHPNDGFDLGLMTKTHPVAWSTNVEARDFLSGQRGSEHQVKLELLNECPKSVLQMNVHHGKSIGLPERGVLFYDGSHVFLHPLEPAKKED